MPSAKELHDAIKEWEKLKPQLSLKRFLKQLVKPRAVGRLKDSSAVSNRTREHVANRTHDHSSFAVQQIAVAVPCWVWVHIDVTKLLRYHH